MFCNVATLFMVVSVSAVAFTTVLSEPAPERLDGLSAPPAFLVLEGLQRGH